MQHEGYIANVNRSRISKIIVPQIFSVSAGGVVDPAEVFLLSSFIIMQNLLTVSHTMWHMYRKSQKFGVLQFGIWSVQADPYGCTSPDFGGRDVAEP